MVRTTAFAALLLLAAPAIAQRADGGAPPALPAPGVPSAPSGIAPQDAEKLKQDILEQARKEYDEKLERAKDEMRNEVRAELATQSASRNWEEEWQEEKKKLELFEVNGYLRLRPTLFQNMDLSRGPDPEGNLLYPRPLVDSDPTKSRTLAWADMRFRVEPTLNISEDIRLKAQIDMLDNLVLGSTPEIDARNPISLLSQNQLPPQAGGAGANSPVDSVRVKRVYGEVNTPVGLLRFGRMGNQWGMGVLYNDGDCLDCDFGDTVDRIQFVTKVAGHYLVPMFDFPNSGPTTAGLQAGQGLVGQPADRDQADDVSGPADLPALGIAVAKRDTDKEAQRKLDNGESVFNYGAYFSYRTQRFDIVGFGANGLPGPASGAIERHGSLYVPDVWLKFARKKLHIETEWAMIYGTINNRALEPTADPTQTQSLTLLQFGGAARGGYSLLDGALSLNGEVGFASGDREPGMGNNNILGNTPTRPGDIDGPQFNCSAPNCSDDTISNFRFNRDYRVDMILWREILGGVTDAVYVKPGVKYDVAEGFSLLANAIYSRAIFKSSTPGGDPNLGIELDPAVSYTSDDGFVATVAYGVLFPLKGLNNPGNPLTGNQPRDAGIAHAIRAIMAVKF